jgi:hypothetical protein
VDAGGGGGGAHPQKFVTTSENIPTPPRELCTLPEIYMLIRLNGSSEIRILNYVRLKRRILK